MGEIIVRSKELVVRSAPLEIHAANGLPVKAGQTQTRAGVPTNAGQPLVPEVDMSGSNDPTSNDKEFDLSGGGGSDPTLATLQNFFTLANNGPGYLRDTRMADGIFADIAKTIPITDGELAYALRNQSPVTGADTMYLEEAGAANQLRWHAGTGLSQVSAQDSYDDIALDPGCAIEEMTAVLVAKYTNYSGIALQIDFGPLRMTLSVDNASPSISVYAQFNTGNFVFTPHASGVIVAMIQYNSGTGEFDVYANNVKVGSLAPSSTSFLSNAATFDISRVDFNDNITDRFMGVAVVPMLLGNGQRQNFVDYFQLNDGVLV